jgi:hypothetical protein
MHEGQEMFVPLMREGYIVGGCTYSYPFTGLAAARPVVSPTPVMTKADGVAWVRSIQNGRGITSDMIDYLDEFGAGAIPVELWKKQDSAFMLGIEYGVLMAIAKLFDLTEEDLKG